MRKFLVLALAWAINATPGTVYVSTDVPKGISGTSLTSTLSVPDSFLLTDVNLSINLSAFESSEHVITLTSPGATSVELFNGNCNGGFDIIMTFDDEAGSGLGSCDDINGDDGLSFQPVNPLSAFDGQDSFGIWTLRVDYTGSSFAGDTSLNSWSLDLSGAPGGNSIPEPATIGLTGAALAALAFRMYRRRSS